MFYYEKFSGGGDPKAQNVYAKLKSVEKVARTNKRDY
jgi:hypothetical protein